MLHLQARSVRETGQDPSYQWIHAARTMLIDGGIAAVKVEALADRLGVTRGSFYWHFSDRADLLNALLDAWIEQNTRPFLKVEERNVGRPIIQLLRYVEVWLSTDVFEPSYVAAMRDWGRTSHVVDAAVCRADETRMDVLYRLFRDLNYPKMEARVRARIMYFHQVGYYTMRIVEPRTSRLKLVPTYFEVLTGYPMPSVPVAWGEIEAACQSGPETEVVAAPLLSSDPPARP